MKWRALLAVAAALLVYWGAHAVLFAYSLPKYERIGPGVWVPYPDYAVEVRLDQMRISDVAADFSGEMTVATTGTSWVGVTLSVRRIEGVADPSYCSFRVLGSGDHYWNTGLNDDSMRLCINAWDEGSVQETVWYAVPKSYLGEITGIAMPSAYTFETTPLLTWE
ncbi:MAG: hypothetical protein LBR58_05880 [Propionibacteriaceae bacterium]|jgi:hypothetical protein|nr:hypothetical protein [Propionibacteriaceae bacterium]